ncbi:uncharacterized protein STEHIDRAFT_164190 [Stereum hirsutum FP-91666 SS1]|uniref:Uncharacterized protein n=1 Tax=Stereum hirsutum (strain FP-91666) TaxID=721885 RepID=R7RVE5_STEHR|nr:uncharacterized protein STEHIDRAFT_164190 [Stereum hirsutum FP-91666 SS1]EIM78929.1 hypothetical protein STEHIDRAFT_164190 [Stereum hirsutum FP-91666 SS1]
MVLTAKSNTNIDDGHSAVCDSNGPSNEPSTLAATLECRKSRPKHIRPYNKEGNMAQ